MGNFPFIHTIVSTNRQDLLERAIESIRPMWNVSCILDNSPDGIESARKWPVPVVRPSVPLSVAQSMNFLFQRAREAGVAAFGYQHEDAEAQPETAAKFLPAVESALSGAQGKWASIFTKYDILSAYCMSAVEDIGEWDTAFPNPNYHIDVDWFYRAKVKGYGIIMSGLPVRHLDGGSVTCKEPWRRQIHSITYPMNQRYYTAKWGGNIHQEKYTVPWNKPVEKKDRVECNPKVDKP